MESDKGSRNERTEQQTKSIDNIDQSIDENNQSIDQIILSIDRMHASIVQINQSIMFTDRHVETERKNYDLSIRACINMAESEKITIEKRSNDRSIDTNHRLIDTNDRSIPIIN